LALALETAESVDQGKRAEALCRIAIVQADSGDQAAARETLKRAIQAGTVQDVRATTDALFAGAHARVGNWDESRRSAQHVRDWALQANVIERLTFEQAKAGEVKNALQWAKAQEP